MYKAMSAAVAAFVATALPAGAETLDEGRVVVTATRSPTRASETLSDVTEIGREQIGTVGQRGLADLLATVAGVEISATGGPGQPATAFLRGANGGHTLVLVDGVRMNSATLGTAALEHIPLHQVERIEVLRGPASSLYGADAIGGVIQIFTRRGDGEPGAYGSLGAGTYRTARGDAGVGGRIGETRFNIHAAYADTRGFNAIANRVDAGNAWNADRDGYRNTNLSGQISQGLAAGHEIGLSFLQSDANAQKDASNCDRATGWTTCTANYDSRTKQTLSNVTAFSRNRITDAWKSTLQWGRSRDDMRDLRYDPATITEFQDRFQTEQTQLTWQNDVRWGPGTLLLAAERLNQAITSSNAYPVRERTINSALAGYHGWFGNHGIQLNARRDSNSQFGAKTTGGITYGYRFAPAWQAVAGIKNGFRAPSFNDLYFPRSAFGGGNAAVRPESSRAEELGLKWEQGAHAASLTWHQNRITDLIEWVEVPLGSGFFTPTNVNKAKIDGWSLAYAGELGAWTMRGSLDLQNPRDTVRDRQLINRAKEHGSFAASRYWGGWRVGMELVASGPRYDDQNNRTRLGGYSVTNLTADHAFRGSWSLFARANNVFDKNYELRRDYAVPRANLFVGVRYEPKS